MSRKSKGEEKFGSGGQESRPPDLSSESHFIWPPPVLPGDVVAVAAPASPVSHEAWEAGVRFLQNWGFEVRSGPEVFQHRPWGAKTDLEVARRFLKIWQDPEVKAIIGARGGYGSLKVLPYLEPELLKTPPKRLVGFSDLTNLLWHLHRRLSLVTFHGPTVAHLPALTEEARTNFYEWFTRGGPRTLSYPGLMVLHPGHAEGPLAGGNLTTLCHLLGTPFAPQFAGYLLFLEDHNEAHYRLDRLIHHLLLSGALAGVRGVVLGSFTGCGSPEGVLEVMAAGLAPLKIPVLAGLRVGHQPDNHTFPLGARARLDSAAASLALLA